MKKKRTLICLLAAVALTTGLAFKFQSSEGQKQNRQQSAQSIPDYEVYHQLFHHHVAMKKKASELLLRLL